MTNDRQQCETRSGLGSHFALASLLFATGCVGPGEPDATPSSLGGAQSTGGTQSTGGEGGSSSVLPLLPWGPGNTWTYRVIDSDGIFTKVTTVGELEPVGLGPNEAVLANRVTTTKRDVTDKTISWQNTDGESVFRYREQSYRVGDVLELEEYWAPHAFHIDGTPEHTRSGARWVASYWETKIFVSGGTLSTPETSPVEDTWQILKTEADRSSVSVPAGTFETPIVFQKSNGASVKTYWYVRGIGKVKETGGQVEELVSYQIVTP